MSNNRNEVISLLDLPLEIPTIALPTMIESTNEANFKATLSNTCRTFYQFFQHELDQHAAQQLLTLILKPTNGFHRGTNQNQDGYHSDVGYMTAIFTQFVKS